MEELLKQHLKTINNFDDEWTNWEYRENINSDANSEDWLKNGTSYIYKVGVLCAIDSNKCDWVYVAIGTQRKENSQPVVIGTLQFEEGENDDMGRVINRAVRLINYTHPAFEGALDF